MGFIDYITSDEVRFETFLLIAVVIFLIAAIIYIIKLEKRNSVKAKIIKQKDDELANVKIYNNMQVMGNNFRFDIYRNMVKKNFKRVFTSGEVVLIDLFRKLLNEPGYDNWNIYGHVNIRGNDASDYQADFIIVCDKGVFVIESKYWSGLTLIYTKGTPNILSYTQFSDYGRVLNAKSTGIQVFNINSKKGEDRLEINKYTNPVEQVRNYSRILNNKLGAPVKNLVVLQCDKRCQVKVDERDLDVFIVDKYTQITTQNGMYSYLQNIKSVDSFDVKKVNEVIQNQFDFSIFLNSSNVNQPPWGD